MSAVFLAGVDDRYLGHMDGWGGGWMWLWGVAMMVLFVVLIVWLARATGGAGSPDSRSASHDANDRAREILGERYARGEMTTDEYRERVDALR